MKLYFFKTPKMKKEVNQAVDVCWKANMDMAEDKKPLCHAIISPLKDINFRECLTEQVIESQAVKHDTIGFSGLKYRFKRTVSMEEVRHAIKGSQETCTDMS